MTAPSKVPTCPECGSGEVVEVVYGYPTFPTSERARRGEIRLGGCLVAFDMENEERASCRSCDHEWSVPAGTFPAMVRLTRVYAVAGSTYIVTDADASFGVTFDRESGEVQPILPPIRPLSIVRNATWDAFDGDPEPILAAANALVSDTLWEVLLLADYEGGI